ncbi:LuxR C-terminal-related transcriptional regulator [Micromonospora sp. NPDC050397]|uniref:helix-turn-helix transcriptional regulator n=1 Tax=Micromonospora sp. NPDC050397 TaxID=3364279 RepID=UPI00384C4449
MRHAPGGDLDGHVPVDASTRALVAHAGTLLTTPGLVVVHGGPGIGRSTVLRRLGDTFHGPVFTGNGLATLVTVPGFALSHALRIRLPTDDPALLAEAVRSRVRTGLLLLDDLQWADPATLAALVPLARHCRVAVALRTPHRLPATAVAELRAVAAGWLAVPPLDPDTAAAVARATAPGLDPATVTDVVRRSGGTPLAVTVLARHATDHPTGTTDADQIGYVVATALADLTRPARTALAALGLLGRPATVALLGAGADELSTAGLVHDTGAGTLAPTSPYLAEVAAGMLDPDGRRALHERLAALVPPAEAARHLAAAGHPDTAYAVAVTAADNADTVGTRADLLLYACDLPGTDPAPATRVAAARAAIAAGRPRAAVRVLTTTAPLGVAASVLRAEALVQLGDLPGARTAVAPVPDSAAAHLVAARDRVLLLAALADGPGPASAALVGVVARHGSTPEHTGLRAAYAAVRAATRQPGWEPSLRTAAADPGDPLTARWSAWLLVETLIADARLAEATRAATEFAQVCADDLAYSWQTRFVGASLWCAALSGATGQVTDEVLRRAGDLTDRTLPPPARAYAVAATSLVEADGGLLAPARARLAAVPAPPGGVLDWVTREAAWLDGQPERATTPSGPVPAGSLLDGLSRITARWAGHDLAAPTTATAAPAPRAPTATIPATAPAAVRLSLAAWDNATHDPTGFTVAATAWHDLTVVREEVRCLLAHGLHEHDSPRAVPALLTAERLAADAGLVVLLGRTRRALRRHAVRRDQRGPRAGTALSDREHDVLRLVAAGEPSRRIAGQLGVSGETVETHIRSGMRKLGARTRTEAAALVLAGVPAPRAAAPTGATPAVATREPGR